MHKFDPKNIEKLDNEERRKDMPPYEILKSFGIGEEGVFLDIGCGIGYFTIPAAKLLKGGIAIGIDILDELLEHAFERADEIENIDFRKCEEYSFPIEDKSADYAMLCNVLHEIKDKVKYLKEVKRVLKKNASLYLIEWDKNYRKSGPPVDHRITKEEIKSYCIEAGLEIIEQIHIGEKYFGLKIQN